jgi:signal-transduction protein with cAMP-binding, CBS, and nucleotidyltransferase domain
MRTALVSTTPDAKHGVVDHVMTMTGILQQVEPGAASALIKQLHPSEFRAGQTIFAEGDPGDRVYIIVAGKVKIILRGPGGRTNLRAILGPTDIFGELAVFDPGPRTCTATAITDVRTAWLDRATLRALMADRPVIGCSPAGYDIPTTNWSSSFPAMWPVVLLASY